MILRVKEIIDNEGISVRAFEQKISASNGVIRKAIANNTDIQGKWIAAIAENYPQYNPEWLLTGNGPMLKSDISAQNTSESPTTEIKDIIQLATRLGEQINENKHLYDENMKLRAQIEKLKEKKENKMPEMPSKAYGDQDLGHQNIAAESEVRYK